MGNELSHSDSEESQVDILIAEYLTRIDAGENVTPDQFITDHAQHADELKQYFSDVSLIDKFPKESQPELEQTMTSLSVTADEGDKTAPNTLIKSAADSETSITKQHLSEESNSKTTLEIPETFGRYKIKKVLGQGAMGAVYLARDTQLDRDVALKIPKFGDMSNVDEQEMLARFYREARAAATLRSPNICPVFDVGEIDGQHYITMAYIKGRPLKDFTKSKKKHSEKQIATTIRKLALGLEEAHEIGVIHRDLKPANIMVDKKAEPVVMDFGLARSSSDEVQVTQSGAIVGTPAYMSPEQVAGEQELIGPQVDIYSLGVIMYELITGVMPFKGNLMAILQQIAINNPKKPSEIRSDIDPRLESICLKMIAGDMQQRYQSMTDVANELQECLRTPHKKSKKGSSQSPSAKPTSIPTAEEESNPALISIEKPKSYAEQLRAKKSKSSSPKTIKDSQAGIATPRNIKLAGGVGGLLLILGIALLVNNGKRDVQIQPPATEKAKVAPTELDLSKGLVGHWGFEDGTGTRVLDSSGKLNHGRLEGGVTWGFDPAPSPYAGKRSLRFDMGSMTVSASSSLSISNEMAFAFWCKMDEYSGARSFIQMGALDINSYLKRVNFNYNLEGVEQRVFQDSGKFKPQGFHGGSWNHVVVNCSKGNAEIWYNGRLFASNPVEGKFSDSVVDLVIGKEIQGSLDDFRIYNRSLNEFEILALANVEENRNELLSEPSKVLNPFEFNGNDSPGKLHSHINFEHGLAIKNLDDHVSTGGIEMDLSEPFCLEVWIAPRSLYKCDYYRRSIVLLGPCQLCIANQGQFSFDPGVYEDLFASIGIDKNTYPIIRRGQI
ncbi:MAG: protein kinase [Planctomicrobium sp.]|nr:protein kinase [Planctomicrobium sp.]